MKIRINIVHNDTSTVAKAVIIDNKDRVLFLKRSNYMDKFAGEWDLPGGHLKGNESLIVGLEREVEEETGLSVSEPKLISVDDNLHFFYCNYDSQPVKISHEHTEYRFFDKNDLDPSQKFQKIAISALEMRND
jgi:8-oxo-dGTP diphosphatase